MDTYVDTYTLFPSPQQEVIQISENICVIYRYRDLSVQGSDLRIRRVISLVQQ